MRKIALIRSSPTLYRLALAWPAVERETIAPAPDAPADPWAGVRFDFTRLAYLADTSPRETIAGFHRLKAYGIITPDGGLADTVEKFFRAEGLAGFGVKVKAPKAPAAE
jgi:hypothetical protein